MSRCNDKLGIGFVWLGGLSRTISSIDDWAYSISGDRNISLSGGKYYCISFSSLDRKLTPDWSSVDDLY